MRSSPRTSHTIALICLMSGISCGTDFQPLAATSVFPASVVQGDVIDLVVRGQFFPDVVVNYQDAERSRVDTTFRVWLGNRELTAVRWIDSSHLSVPAPADLALGFHDLVVIDPQRRRVSLPNALEVTDIATMQLRVTTNADEDDVGATVAAPGGSGLSLREAVHLLNAASEVVRITITTGTRVALVEPLPTVVGVAGSAIAGVDVEVDGTALSSNQSCLIVETDNALVSGVSFVGCPEAAVVLRGAGDVVSDCSMSGGGQGTVLEGPDGQIGPGNLIYSNGTGLLVSGDDALILHNVLAFHDEDGAKQDGRAKRLVFVNNVVSHNGRAGLRWGDRDIKTLRNNGWFENNDEHCAGCTPGQGAVLEDPLYTKGSAPGLNFRPLPSSPLIDAGFDFGLDRNGDLPGTFEGEGFDIGAFEQ